MLYILFWLLIGEKNKNISDGNLLGFMNLLGSVTISKVVMQRKMHPISSIRTLNHWFAPLL
jgi:hypothetical protein